MYHFLFVVKWPLCLEDFNILSEMFRPMGNFLKMQFRANFKRQNHLISFRDLSVLKTSAANGNNFSIWICICVICLPSFVFPTG